MEPECASSDPSKPHKLCRRDHPEHSGCNVCGDKFNEDEDTFFCSICNIESHIGCYKFSLEIRNHPYHPSHSLKLINLSNSDSSIPLSWPEEEVPSPPDESLRGCKCCQRQLQDMYYHCDDCMFSLNATCALNPPPRTIEITEIPDENKVKRKKIHGDCTTFYLFPRRISLPCDACGESLNKTSDHAYTCIDRNYIAHGKCIKKLPSVIKITRHKHRLSYNHSLFSRAIPGISCGVCHKSVNVNYGQYSCHKDCHYAVHSKCATREDVWNGKDLDGEPEELEEDGDPFERINKDTILHFSHEHNLKLHGGKKDLGDGSKFCQACVLVIHESDSVYSCTNCDFILHELCASLPRSIDSQLHKHRLTLIPVLTTLYLIQFTVFVQGMFKCSGCHQRGCGFMYQCKEKGCRFQLDVRCASLGDTVNHRSHHHPLYFNVTKGKCIGCDSTQCSPFYLESSACKLFLGFKCAMLPEVVHYKYDSHLLKLCYGEKDTTSGQYWCEICELKLDAKKWFYTCDDCRVTLHVTCLLGKEVYMKPNHTIKINDYKVEIVPNNGNPRPFCDKCGDRCVDTLVFKRIDRYCCTLDCMKKSLDREIREEKQQQEEKQQEEEAQG